MQVKETTLAISHLLVIVLTATITYFALDWRDKSEPIPIDPDTYRIEERIRIESEVVKPLRDSLTSSIKTIGELKEIKPRTRIIYKERQDENIAIADSASYNLVTRRIRPTEILLFGKSNQGD